MLPLSIMDGRGMAEKVNEFVQSSVEVYQV